MKGKKKGRRGKGKKGGAAVAFSEERQRERAQAGGSRRSPNVQTHEPVKEISP